MLVTQGAVLRVTEDIPLRRYRVLALAKKNWQKPEK
jgi:hypothetical protein